MDDVSGSRQEDERNREKRASIGSVKPMLLTIPQAARVLAIGRTTMYELIAEGAIEVVRIGRSARIPVDAVRSFVDQQRVDE
jgi:excisionase family DNA binding protein